MDSTFTPQGLGLFVKNSYVRSSWIAFFTLWSFWGLSYFLRHVIERNNNKNQTDTEAIGTSTNKEDIFNNSWSNRIASSHDVLFENTLLLLSVLTLNTFGSGATHAVMVLSWIFFAFTLINAITQVGVNHHFIRLGFNIVFFGVTLAIGGLSFSQGW